MKCILGFDSQCGECVGPSVTMTAFQHWSSITQKSEQATRVVSLPMLTFLTNIKPTFSAADAQRLPGGIKM